MNYKRDIDYDHYDINFDKSIWESFRVCKITHSQEYSIYVDLRLEHARNKIQIWYSMQP